jgi:hypothetical protein
MKENKVYCVNIKNLDSELSPLGWDDKTFMSKAEEQGLVYTLKGFERCFNDEDIDYDYTFIRIIEIENKTKLIQKILNIKNKFFKFKK